MTPEFRKTIELYQSDVIDKTGKIELLQEFTKATGKSKAQFDQIVRKQNRFPTPTEENWLNKHVRLYYDRYSAHKKGVNVETNGQLSLEIPQSA